MYRQNKIFNFRNKIAQYGTQIKTSYTFDFFVACKPVVFLLLAMFIVSGPANARTDDRVASANLETHRLIEGTSQNNLRSGDEERKRNGWYSGIHIGAVLSPDMEIRGSLLKADIRYDVGYIFDVLIGYKMPIGVRVEGEFSYRNVETDSVYSVSGKTRYGDGIGGAESVSALMNGWYDFDFVFTNWYPYVGLGLGYMKLWIDPGHDGAVTVIDSSDSSLVGQVGFGIVYRYTRDIEISLDYRYLRSLLDFEFYYEPKYPGANDATFETHSFMLGFRGFF